MAILKYGIIGHPVSHSLSPAMQNAAFHALGIDAEYSAYDVEAAGLEEFLSSLVRNKIAGLNVTIPHKIKAKEYIESNGELDQNASRLGAVNTIKVGDSGRLRGFNTDGPGFYRSLVEDLKFEPEGREVFVLGAGGASRAVIMYLGNAPKKITVWDIDKSKTEGLREHYAKFYDAKRLAVTDEEGFKAALERGGLLVNATPVGMMKTDPSPIDKALLHPGLRVYDLVYNRPLTALVKEANSKKCHAVSGLGMLLYQGAIAFEIWTGKQAPMAVMRKALREALRSNQVRSGSDN